MKRLAWCAEAEPRLLAWAQAVASREIDATAAADELARLVGRLRFDADYQAWQKDHPPPPGVDKRLWAILEFEKDYPRGDLHWRIWQPVGDSTVEQIRAELGIRFKLAKAEYTDPWEWQPWEGKPPAAARRR